MNKQELISFLKWEAKAILNMPRIYLPMPKRIRQQYFDEAQRKLDFYQPKIEERTGVSLGKIEIRDRKDLCKDAIRDHVIEAVFTEGPLISPIPPEIAILAPYELIINPIAKILSGLSGLTTLMNYNNHGIYINFNLGRKIDLFWFNKRQIEDVGIVHELCHELWKRLEKQPYKSQEGSMTEYRIWNEGFATYCSEVAFKDFYPEGTRRIETYPRIYTEGLARIIQLVNQHGNQILKDIPKDWREFSKQFKYEQKT
jgi:hypothetical protein